uniref:Uncharacterized protein n=1 Tax=Amphimedon queenslandica TaxID=400682 RepID=A0A1X7T4X2_AMPQE
MVDDIGEVCPREAVVTHESNQLTITGEILSVIYDEQMKCPLCDWKISVSTAQAILQCSNCSAKFKSSKAKKNSLAKLQIKDLDGEIHKVTMFNSVLSSLLNINLPRESNEEHLLSMDSIKATPIRLVVSRFPPAYAASNFC